MNIEYGKTGNRTFIGNLTGLLLFTACYVFVLLGTVSAAGIAFDPLMLLPGAVAAASCLVSGRGAQTAVCVILAAAAVVVMIAYAPARTGAAELLQQVFDASEAANRYEYMDLAEAGNVSASALRAAGLSLCMLLASLCLAAAFLSPAFGALLAAAAAAFEVFFGIVPKSAALNAAMFCALILCLFYGGGRRLRISAAFIPAVLAAAVFALTAAAFPGVDAEIERSSELARDRISSYMDETYERIETGQVLRRTKHESRFAETPRQNVPETGDLTQMYRDEVEREDISLPDVKRKANIPLIILEIIALFLLPFVPFWLLEKRRRKLESMRAGFGSEDISAAVRAMFRHSLDCLEACGLEPGNRDNSCLAGDVASLFSGQLADSYRKAELCWRKACYSRQLPDENDRDRLFDLVRKSESEALEKSRRSKRFRMKYIDCLISGV